MIFSHTTIPQHVYVLLSGVAAILILLFAAVFLLGLA
jgi:hypothetical protein